MDALSRIIPHDRVAGLPMEFLTRANAELEDATARAIVEWVLHHARGLRVGLTSAFGPEGCALVDLVRRIDASIPVFTIDTGLLFDESIAVREAYRALGANIVVVEPESSLAEQTREFGANLFERDPNRCCAIRKVEPMHRILDAVDVWITAIRRDQTSTRATTNVLGTAARRDGSQVLKVAPLARWTRQTTWTYLLARELPYNGLLDEGYTSIGCRPCTQKPVVLTGERGGRWVGHEKTECGIHNL